MKILDNGDYDLKFVETLDWIEAKMDDVDCKTLELRLWFLRQELYLKQVDQETLKYMPKFTNHFLRINMFKDFAKEIQN